MLALVTLKMMKRPGLDFPDSEVSLGGVTLKYIDGSY